MVFAVFEASRDFIFVTTKYSLFPSVRFFLKRRSQQFPAPLPSLSRFQRDTQKISRGNSNQ